MRFLSILFFCFFVINTNAAKVVYLQKYLDDKIAHTTINEESKVASIEPPEVKEYELEDNTNVIDKEIWKRCDRLAMECQPK